MAQLRNNNVIWRRLLREALVAGRFITRPALTVRILDRQPGPQELDAGELVVVVNSGKPAWACFLCPGNCGQYVQLSLNLLHRPRWAVNTDFLARPTISPATCRHSECGAHFVIHHGRIDWMEDVSDRNCLSPHGAGKLARVRKYLVGDY